ncbi:MAG: malonate-semialdehyde dehydrogenase (acetylating)/methylmalonate-semialdehyde dehydrogenase, partial [Lysobacterales bacterium]
METVTHFINGQRESGTGNRSLDVFNPATGQVQRQVQMATAADVDAAVKAA